MLFGSFYIPNILIITAVFIRKKKLNNFKFHFFILKMSG